MTFCKGVTLEIKMSQSVKQWLWNLPLTATSLTNRKLQGKAFWNSVLKIGSHHGSHRQMYLSMSKAKSSKDRNEDSFIAICYWASICPWHAQWCTGIIFSKSSKMGWQSSTDFFGVTMTHHCSDPCPLLTLTVKGYLPPFPPHYSWVKWPHHTHTLSSTAGS